MVACAAHMAEISLLPSDTWNIRVVRLNGDALQVVVAADSTVADLLDIINAQVEHPPVHSAALEGGLVEPALLSESGDIMEPSMLLSYYDISDDSQVTFVIKRNTDGWYVCWVELDSSNPFCIDRVSINVFVQADDVRINGIAGKLCHRTGERLSVRLSQALHLRSRRAFSRARFEATDCELVFQDGNLAENWWHPLEGRLLGSSPSGATHCSFKGRYEKAVPGREA